jgi:hypothetical protein
VAGVGEDGVLSTIADYVVGGGRGHDRLHLHIGGLLSPTDEHVTWRNVRLKFGDEVIVRSATLVSKLQT